MSLTPFWLHVPPGTLAQARKHLCLRKLSCWSSSSSSPLLLPSPCRSFHRGPLPLTPSSIFVPFLRLSQLGSSPAPGSPITHGVKTDYFLGLRRHSAHGKTVAAFPIQRGGQDTRSSFCRPMTWGRQTLFGPWLQGTLG